MIKKSAELNSDDREIYFKVLELLKDSGQAKRKLNYINNCNKGEIVMHNYFGFFIQQLCKEMNLKFKNTKAPINVKYNMPLGVFKVNFKNSYEDVYLNFYKTEMSLLERNKSKSEYYVNISFDLINVSV